MSNADNIGTARRTCKGASTTTAGQESPHEDVRHLALVAPTDSGAGEKWDAAIARNVAAAINRELRENPPPPDARTANEWRGYAGTLLAQANVQLAAARWRDREEA